MNKTNKEAAIEDIARHSLDCIEKVAAGAENARASHRRGDARVFTTINTLNSPQAVKSIGSISDSEAEAIVALIQQPVIARIHFLDENDEEETIFITRTTPRSVPGYKIASYRSDLGKIASLAAGDEGSFKFGARERNLLIDSRALLKPERTSSGWDSRETEIDIRDLGRFTVGSLREILTPEGEIEEGDLEAVWNDDTDENVVEGIRRAIITHMGLRDQPILDRYQDEIFRMPINSKCFLSGPPGTGKTTTLIRRLGQKTDRQALQESPPRKHDLAIAMREIGRIERTLFIIEWALDIDMQRRANVGLNKGEAHHALKNALRIGRQGEIRDRTTESQHFRLAGLNLLTAILVYWNTDQLGKAVMQRKRAGLKTPEHLLRHISPLGWEHILLIGQYIWRKISAEIA